MLRWEFFIDYTDGDLKGLKNIIEGPPETMFVGIPELECEIDRFKKAFGSVTESISTNPIGTLKNYIEAEMLDRASYKVRGII